ncbi:L-asparaginase II [Candidatus Nanopelagicus limnes]|uniref:L-asparaginase II n=1 Tax=Candidatus Nanopelagicus limnae TaxID=1884634 RepID=A0A249JZ80_9ACTN|nr:asparaginase [Candidatus Nanopelagicus limnes]ASY09825.1 L-asparaginase II [Candidatus Nanopelagicus limnes]
MKDNLKINEKFTGEVLAKVTRGDLVESLHLGHLIVLNADGSTYLSKGSPELPIYPRSAIKSLQAAGMLKAGLEVEENELAIICASHSGSQSHIDLVTKMLTARGLSTSQLKNAVDKPLGEKEKISWGDKAPSQLAQNCSGKHAGMLITCQQNGWDMNTYLDLKHPLQVAIKNEIEDLSGEKVSATSVDGCGAPLFAISLIGLAKAISNLVKSKEESYQQIVLACTKYPELVAGDGRLTTRMMRAVPGLFMKEGAEGVQVCALSDGRVIAIKIIDGSWRPVAPIITEILKRWGIEMPDESVKIYGGSSVIGEVIANI